jgi:hypothetical protein
MLAGDIAVRLSVGFVSLGIATNVIREYSRIDLDFLNHTPQLSENQECRSYI